MGIHKYNQMTDFAEALVNIAIKKYVEGQKDAFYPLLIGEYSYHVGYPDERQNFQAVLDAIHIRYDVYHEDNVLKAFYDGLEYLLERNQMKWFEDYMCYQLELEKENRTADVKRFLIDRSFLKELSPVYRSRLRQMGLLWGTIHKGDGFTIVNCGGDYAIMYLQSKGGCDHISAFLISSELAHKAMKSDTTSEEIYRIMLQAEKDGRRINLFDGIVPFVD